MKMRLLLADVTSDGERKKKIGRGRTAAAAVKQWVVFGVLLMLLLVCRRRRWCYGVRQWGWRRDVGWLLVGTGQRQEMTALAGWFCGDAWREEKKRKGGDATEVLVWLEMVHRRWFPGGDAAVIMRLGERKEMGEAMGFCSKRGKWFRVYDLILLKEEEMGDLISVIDHMRSTAVIKMCQWIGFKLWLI